MVPGLRPEYTVMTTAYFWFWALAGAMLWLAWRAREGERVGRRSFGGNAGNTSLPPDH